MKTAPLDLIAAAHLAFDYFNGHMDRRSGYPFIWTYLLTDPPKLSHDGWDTVEVVGRLLEGLVPLRVMTQSNAGLETELRLRDDLLACQNERDGLIYRPRLSYTVPIADIYDQSSAMLGLTARVLADQDPSCVRAVERLMLGLWKLAEWDGQTYARFLCVGVQDGKRLDNYEGQVTENDNPTAPDAAWFGRLIRPLLQYHKATSREQPLAFALALARDIAFRSDRFAPDGSFSRALFGEDSIWTNGHFHSRANTMAGILRLAVHVGDKPLLEWGNRVFRWALRHGTDFGWYPEFVGRRNVKTEGCETCGVVDMFDAAVALAGAGHEDCWAIADRIWRNQMLENQLRDISWIPPGRRRDDTELETFDRVPQRSLGGFAGWAGPNDLISDFEDEAFAVLDRSQDHRRSLMGCCSSSGAKGLYLAWHEAVVMNADTLQVNFAVSRDCRLATVRCLEPQAGQLELEIKADCHLKIRPPAGVAVEAMKIARDGHLGESFAEAGLANLRHLRAGQKVVVSYDLAERTTATTVGGWDFTTPVEYQVQWRGSTVVGISPTGRHCPLYQRGGQGAAKRGPAALAHEYDY